VKSEVIKVSEPFCFFFSFWETKPPLSPTNRKAKMQPSMSRYKCRFFFRRSRTWWNYNSATGT
jgi:hypothetical protein